MTFASIYLLALTNMYESPFAFTGAIIRVMDISEASFEQLAEEYETNARVAMAIQ